MKKLRFIWMCFFVLLLTTGVAFAQNPGEALTYEAHVSQIGWMEPVNNGGLAGTTGQALSLEALKFNYPSTDGSKIECRAHISNIGWQDYIPNGEVVGTTGQNQHIEAIQIRLTEPLASNYDIYYRSHVSNIGWLGWTSNDQLSGTTGFALPIEGIEIQLLPKGQGAPGDTTRPSITPDTLPESGQIHYLTSLDGPGWQETKMNGQDAGTIDVNVPIDGLIMSLPEFAGGIRYRVGTWSYGWMDWTQDAQVAGLPGRGQFIESMQAELYGPAASLYDLYYQVNNSNVGWMGWAKNGQETGTFQSYNYTQAVRAVLLPKGQTPEGYDPNVPTTQTFEFERPGNCVGRNYVFVSIPRQQLIYFDANNNPIFKTPIVSGQTGSPYSETPTGNFILNSKQREVDLYGSDYVSHVHFWLPFIGKQYGIHDADSWRESYEYGGRTYQLDGSHGCVNLPYQSVATLFNMIRIGDPVIIR